jgi:ATP-binding cassette, subfamily B (MDR/TAP), member 1
LDNVSRARTTVCIAHRLSTIKQADNIVVLSHGEVSEQGTHDELYARGGVFHGLVEAQHLSAVDESRDLDILQSEHDSSYLSRLHAKVERPTTFVSQMYKTVSSIDPEAKLANSGIVEKRQYRNFDLIKKVSLGPSQTLIIQAFQFNNTEKGWIALGWSMILITGGIFPAQGLLIAYAIAAFVSPDIGYLRARANLFSLCWFVVAIAEFIGYTVYHWSFGYTAERMVLP